MGIELERPCSHRSKPMSQEAFVVTVRTLEESMGRTEDAMEAVLEGDLPDEEPPKRIT